MNKIGNTRDKKGIKHEQYIESESDNNIQRDAKEQTPKFKIKPFMISMFITLISFMILLLTTIFRVEYEIQRIFGYITLISLIITAILV